jgi:hypothetical protein
MTKVVGQVEMVKSEEIVDGGCPGREREEARGEGEIVGAGGWHAADLVEVRRHVECGLGARDVKGCEPGLVNRDGFDRKGFGGGLGDADKVVEEIFDG